VESKTEGQRAADRVKGSAQLDNVFIKLCEKYKWPRDRAKFWLERKPEKKLHKAGATVESARLKDGDTIRAVLRSQGTTAMPTDSILATVQKYSRWKQGDRQDSMYSTVHNAVQYCAVLCGAVLW